MITCRSGMELYHIGMTGSEVFLFGWIKYEVGFRAQKYTSVMGVSL